MRSRVVLPAPLAPTSATLAPSPTRNETSSSSTRPSGQLVPDSGDIDVTHDASSLLLAPTRRLANAS